MKQEDKELLLKDLCARLPYKTEIQVNDWTTLTTTLKVGHISRLLNEDLEIKPYLFPISSMTEEQLLELASISFENSIDSSIKTSDWCYRNHYDVNNLIRMGLANDATGLNIY